MCAVCRVLFVGCWLLRVARRVLFGVRWLLCVLFLACCAVCGVCWLPCAAWFIQCVVCCVLSVGWCLLLCVVLCVLSAGCCVLSAD